jgi:hypothetical protein
MKTIIDHFDFSSQNLDFRDFCSNLNQKTRLTDVYLSAITWLHLKETLNLKEYII